MRSVAMRIVAALLVTLCTGRTVLAAGELWEEFRLGPLEWGGPGGGRMRLTIAERLRGEFVDWFGDPKTGSPAPRRQSRYDFLGHRFQLGIGWSTERLEFFAQGQNTVVADLPERGVGVGSVYFANTPDRHQATVFLRQGWAQYRNGPFALVLGRQLYRDAGQGLAQDPSLRWVQEMRWSQRLLGPFDYTHAGRSFDGLALALRKEPLEVSGFAFVPTYGGFETDAMRNIPEIRVAGTSISLLDSLLPNTVARAFWMLYQDERALLVTDNRPLAQRQQTVGRMLDIHTLGANVAHIVPAGEGKLDLTAFFYGQVGSWQDLDHRAWAYGAEAGYRWTRVWAAPWLRTGVNAASGDPDPSDGSHESFFQGLPTAWQYAMFPFYNMMNNQDVFAQAILAPASWWQVRLDWHWLRVQKRKDLVYSGGGATSKTFFGYGGLPTSGEAELAHLVHAYTTLRIHPNAALNLLYGHAVGQAIVAAQGLQRHANYGFLEMQVTF